MIDLGDASAKNNTEQATLQKWKPVLEELKKLKREGLLEAYVLFERVDEDLAKDYANYYAAHRAELERYVWTYWCGFD
jgi:hypothetical protein